MHLLPMHISLHKRSHRTSHVHNIQDFTCPATASSCSCMCVYSVSCRWCTHIDQARVVSLSQVVQHRRFIEAGEVGHVLHFAEARRIHTLDLLPGQGHPPLAVCQLHLHLIAALLSDAGRLDLIEKTLRSFHLVTENKITLV